MLLRKAVVKKKKGRKKERILFEIDIMSIKPYC